MKIERVLLGTADPPQESELAKHLRALKIPDVQVVPLDQVQNLPQDEVDLVILDFSRQTPQDVKTAVRDVQDRLQAPLLLVVDEQTVQHLRKVHLRGAWACLVHPVTRPQLEHMMHLVHSHAQLLRQLQRMELLFRAIRNVDRVIEEEQSLDSLLEKVCLTLSRTAQYLTMGIWVQEPGRSGRWAGFEFSPPIKITTDPEDPAPWSEVYRTWSPSILSNSDLDALVPTQEWAKGLKEQGYRSVAAFPILHRSQLLGILTVLSQESEFLPAETEVLNGLAENLGHVLYTFTVEREREAIEDAYQSLVEQSIQGIAILQDQQFVYVNPATARILGYDPEELLVMSKDQGITLIEPEDRARFVEEYQALITKQKSMVRGEIRVRHKNGSTLWLLYTAQAIEYRDRPAIQVFFVDITKQKRMEDRLRDALNEWTQTFEAIGEGISIHRPDGTIIRANVALSKLLGRSLRDIIGKKCFEVFHKKNHFLEDCPLVRASKSKNPDTLELYEPTLQRHLRISCYPVLDEEDRVQTIVHVARDITQEKELLASLEKSERRYRYFVEQTGEGFYRMASRVPIPTDLPIEKQIQMMYEHMYVAECNDIFAKMYGYRSAEEIIGQPFVTLHGSPDVPENIEALRFFIENGYRVLDVETKEVDKDGRTVYFLNNAVGIIEDGYLVEVWGTQRNITERKILEERIREAERRFQSIFENAVEGIYQSTPDGRFLMVNPALARILGYDSPEDLMGSVQDIQAQIYVDPKDRDRFQKEIQEKGIVENFVYAARRKDGKIVWLSENTRVVRDPEGNVLYYEGMVEDITRQKELQEQLLQSQKMEAIGRVVSGIVHDFNNLLVPILGYAEILEKTLGQDPTGSQAIRVIKDAAQQAASLTRQLLAFTRRQPSRMEDVELNSFLKEVIQIVKRVIGEDIRLKTVYAKEPIWCKADRAQLQQVVMNLVINARDAMPKGGHLTIGLEPVTVNEEDLTGENEIRPGPYAKIWVQDTGVGMDDETLARIFEPFFTTKKPGEGTGLGLSVVYGIVKQHGGWIRVSSRPGEGTTFWVYLPREVRKPKKSSAKRQRKAQRPLQGTGEWVLVVEDEPQVRDLAVKVLSENGYRVLQASTAGEAVKVFQNVGGKIQVLFSDVILPDGTGYELAEQLRTQNPNLKIILASGYTDDRISLDRMEKEGFYFVSKPYTATFLLETVRKVLEEKE